MAEREMVLRGGGETPWHAMRDLTMNMHGLSKSDPSRAPDRAIGHEISTRLVYVPAGGGADLHKLIPKALWVAEAKWHVAA